VLLPSTKNRAISTFNGPEDVALPTVSVIVPTRNRSAALADLLAGLAVQVYPAARMEVLVVDNDSSDETEAVVKEAMASLPFSLRYHRKQNDGPASSRNRGAEMATGDILAFTDSDCIPSAGWIRKAVAEFVEGVGLVCGPIEPFDAKPDDDFFTHQIHEVNREDGLYPTANVFYRRDVFMSLGMFDETMREYSWGQPVGGDDTEMGWRVRRAGYRSAFANGAVVFHQATAVSPRAYLLSSLAARILPKLVKKIPELRDTSFYRRYFLHKQSATFYLLLLGIVASRKNRWAALLAIPYLRTVWPAIKIDAWPPRRWGRAAMRLGLQIESSALLSATLIVSSIRNRRLVL
jgi:glycosyltransferase involved in cell wall biosynthesis